MRQADRLNQFLRLKLSGVSELWFTVGLLENGAVYCRELHFNEEEYLERWWIPLFRGIIHWLPELEVLSQRIACHMDVELAKSHYEQWYGTGAKRMEWIHSICCMATILRTEFLPNDIGRKYLGDLVAALLDLGMIKRNGQFLYGAIKRR